MPDQDLFFGYLPRQEDDILRQQQYESAAIPLDIHYEKISGLSKELQQKLMQVKPATIAQAKRIPGMTPAAISLLLIHLKKMGGLSPES